MLIGTEDEVETVNKFEHLKKKEELLPWYIIDEDSHVAMFHKTTVESLTLLQMFITPPTLIFEDFKE